MSNFGAKFQAEEVRELDFSALTAAFQNLGGVIQSTSKVVFVNNSMDVDCYFTTTAKKELRIAAGSAKAIDFRTNDIYFIPGMQMKVSLIDGTPANAPTIGTVWAEVVYT